MARQYRNRAVLHKFQMQIILQIFRLHTPSWSWGFTWGEGYEKKGTVLKEAKKKIILSKTC